MTHIDPNMKTDRPWDPRVADATFDALIELYSAQTKHPTPFHSHHEGYAVLLEEVDELWEQIKRQGKDPAAIRKEAVQVAAMALRFLVETSPRLISAAPVSAPADAAGGEPVLGKSHTANLCK